MKKIFISKKAQKHASKGDFIYPVQYFPKKVLTMKSGGHGQENIHFLTKKKTDQLNLKLVQKQK